MFGNAAAGPLSVWSCRYYLTIKTLHNLKGAAEDPWISVKEHPGDIVCAHATAFLSLPFVAFPRCWLFVFSAFR